MTARSGTIIPARMTIDEEQIDRYPSTGIDPLDDMLTRLQYGDNVVWQVDDIEHYRELVVPYVQRAIREHRKMIYIRFAEHAPLLEPSARD